MESLQALIEKIEQLERRVEMLQQKRTYQGDIVPGAIKNRAMGESNSYMYTGLAADRPTEGIFIPPFTTSVYFAYDTGEFSIWTGTAWLSVTLT